MSKNITLSDLNDAIKPLIEAMNKLREECLGNSTQVSEMHQMLTTVSLKLDAVDQTVTTAAATSTRTTGKKLVGRKGAGEKKPTKRGAKKVAEPAEEDDAEDDNGNAEEDNAEDDNNAPEDDNDDAGDKESTKAGKSVKKAPPKKAATKASAKASTKTTKTTKKAATTTKKKQFNKMNFFKKEFEADETQFYKTLTKKIRDKVEAEKENADKLKELEGDALKRARANIYYHYLKDNNADVLEGLRAKFDAENADAGDGEGDAEEDGVADE